MRSVLGVQEFWRACQAGTGTNNALSQAGFVIEFESNAAREVNNAAREVNTVKLPLNDMWKAIMKRVLDRRAN